MQLAAMLMLVPLSLFLPMAFAWGPKSAGIRLAAMLVLTWYLVSLWKAYPGMHDRVVGWAVAGFLVLLVGRRMSLLGGRRRGRSAGGGGGGPVVPRQGGGMVIGPRPFNAGGRRSAPPTVVVVADRGVRAARGVAGRVGRGSRRLEVVGGTAVRNLREGRPPWWRERAGRTYLWAGWTLERLRAQQLAREPWRRNRRSVEDLYADVERGQPGPVWRRRAGRWLEVGRLRRDLDGDDR